MNYIKLIHSLFGLLFCIIAVSSFALSYVNLQAAAVEAGIPGALSPLWPLCLDAFMIMGSLFILQASLNDENTWQGWLVLSSFTLVSIIFNVVHSPADLFSQAAHAIPPIALCASLELMMIQIKRDLQKNSTHSVHSEFSELPELNDQLPSEKHQKVLLWFRENPDGSVEQARKDLKMGYTTVSKIRDELMNSGSLQVTLTPE